MEVLNLEKFSPKKAELTSLAAKYKDLSIANMEDKEGYAAVHSARVELKSVRVAIKKTGKELRAEAVAFQKAVLSKEKELVEIIEPIEKDLQEKQDFVDDEGQRIKDEEEKKKQEVLDNRINELLSYGMRFEDGIYSLGELSIELEVLKIMTIERFLEFSKEVEDVCTAELERVEAEDLERKKENERLEKEKAEQDAEREKIEADKAKIESDKLKIENEKKKLQDQKDAAEREKQKEIEIEKARKEAAEGAKKEAEAEAKKKAEAERLAEKERLEKEQAEAEKLEKRTKYKSFLKEHGYSDSKKEFFHVHKTDTHMVLFKKVGEFKI